jgi:endonuclease YncB( thermonuclease family)
VLIVPEEPDGETLPVSVVRVFDGDGFLAKVHVPTRAIEMELSVRMGFIDAPEMEQPGGKEARDFLHSIIAGKRLELAILMKMDTGGIVDRHGRVVAVPYIRQAAPPSLTVPSTARSIFRNVELEMVVNGWAWVLERYCPDERYFEALEDARRHRRGIWTRDDNIHPWEIKTDRYRSRRSPPTTASPSAQPNHPANCEAPGCHGHLIERQGRFGKFLGCSTFPRCRYSRSLSDG